MKYIVKFILILLAFIALIPFWLLMLIFSIYAWDWRYWNIWEDCYFELFDEINFFNIK